MDYSGYLVVVLLVGCSLAQKTYKRGCDCEYTIDGKCAYTLMLPSNNDQSTCPKAASDRWSAEVDSMKQQVGWVNSNISSITNINHQQAQSLNVLQNALLVQSMLVQNLTARVDSMPGCKNCVKSNTGCQDCQDVKETAQVTQDRLQRQQQKLEELQQNMNSMTEDTERLRSRLTAWVFTFTANINRLESQIKAVEDKMTSMEGRLGCMKRGLLVDTYHSEVKITASSRLDTATGAERGRIYSQKDGDLSGAWCAGRRNETRDNGCNDRRVACPYWALDGECQRNPDYMNVYCRHSCKVPCAEPNQDEWLMFDLSKPRTIFGVVSRGRQDYAQWVTTYQLQYTNQLAGNETEWNLASDPIGAPVTFPGNTDQHTLQTNMLWQPISARYVRIVPLTANQNNRCMRADLIGCVDS